MSKTYLIILCFSFSSSARAYIRQPHPPAAKSLELSLQTEFFRSNANYLKWSEYATLPPENSFQYVFLKPQFSYSPFKNHYIRLSGFADNFYALSQTSQKSYELPFKLSVLGGSVYLYHKIQSLFIGLKLTGAYSLHSVHKLVLNNPLTIQSNEIIVGETASYFEPALSFIFKPSEYFYLYNQVSLRYRTAGLSSLIFLNLGAAVTSHNFSFGLSLDTFFSTFILDRFTNSPASRHNILEGANAGSYKFYSVNPSVVSGTLWLDFKYNFFNTNLYINLDTLGKNYGKGLTIGLITRFKWLLQSKDSFLEKKRRKKNQYIDFRKRGDSLNHMNNQRENKEKSYFEETEDPYMKNDINLELREELHLLNK